MLSELQGRWQVIVIGAGPAGSAAAITAARQGLEVLLVDAKRFPRRKVCGGCLNRVSVQLLIRLLGREHPVWETAIPLRAFHLAHGHRQFRFLTPEGLAVERSVLDAYLIEAAQLAGVKFLSPVTAKVGALCVESNSRQVILACADQTKIVDARAVVLASGLGSRSACDLPELKQVARAGSRVGLEAVFEHFPAYYQRHSIYMVVGQQGYVGLTQIVGERLHVAAAVERSALQQLGPARLTARILESAGAHRLEEDQSIVWRGTPPLSARARCLAAERIFLVGDAAGYIEPFTGEGIRWALESGMGVAAFLEQAQQTWNPELGPAWEAWYRANIGMQQRLCRQIAWGLRQPAARWLGHRLLCISPLFAKSVIARLNR